MSFLFVSLKALRRTRVSNQRQPGEQQTPAEAHLQAMTAPKILDAKPVHCAPCTDDSAPVARLLAKTVRTSSTWQMARIAPAKDPVMMIPSAMLREL